MRGNLTNDGVYTYTYDTAGHMVRAESLTATLVYTYTSAALSVCHEWPNADGLRVVQDLSGTTTAFTWPVPELVLSVVEGLLRESEIWTLLRISLISGTAPQRCVPPVWHALSLLHLSDDIAFLIRCRLPGIASIASRTRSARLR
jgi:hypothetical protein